MRGCAVSWSNIDVCYCDMFSVVNVYLDHLKLCVVCINGRRYVCCGECYVVSDECDEPTSCLVQPIVPFHNIPSPFLSVMLLFATTRSVVTSVKVPVVEVAKRTN